MKICIFYDNQAKGYAWDDAEDHGGYDRISPVGYFDTSSECEKDAKECFPHEEIEFIRGVPDHYPDDYPN